MRRIEDLDDKERKMRKIGDLDYFEKEMQTHLQKDYISKVSFDSWLVVFFTILVFELAFTLYWVYPQQEEIQELKAGVEKIEKITVTPEDINRLNGVISQLREELRRGEIPLDPELSFRINRAILGEGERRAYIQELKALQDKISSLERDIAAMARSQGVNLPSPKIIPPKIIPPRARGRGR